MNAERWRRRTMPGLRSPVPHLGQNDSLKETAAMDIKKPRGFSKALRSLSSSSMESMSQSPSRSQTAGRRLQKSHSASSSSMIERIHRRVSKDSPLSSSPPDMPRSPGLVVDVPYASMEIVQYGTLRADVSLLKARSEYLVLTDQCLVLFGSLDAAKALFPQLNGTNAPPRGKASAAEPRLEIPLQSVVAAFNEEGSSPRFGIEVWWFSPWPRLAYSKTHFFFAHPRERDDWLTDIQRACRLRFRTSPVASMIPDNLKTRINHIVDNTEQATAPRMAQNLTFPVAKRTIPLPQKTNSVEDPQNLIDSSSFYIVIGPCMCYFLEVLKADYMTSPGDLRIKVQSFGSVTLTRFKASVASHEQRFVMNFRLPFGRENRLELASTHYRRIIETMTKVDRELKPMWPQHLQQAIFEINGLPPPLQLTSGNDLGGIERSLRAYCAAFRVQMPRWTIEWNTPSQPTFRLLPPDGSQYLPLQLLAVFRALRYNSFFKALSFRDVDLSALSGKKDYSHYGDSVVSTSLTGLTISDEHYDLLVQAPVLTQEFHALVFASESIRSLDLANIYGNRHATSRQTRPRTDSTQAQQLSSEILRPVLFLLRRQLGLCHGLTLSGNPLADGDVEDLANLLVLDNVHLKKLELDNCSIGDAGLSRLWVGMAGQASTLQVLNTAENHGIVKFDIMQHSLSQLRALTKLTIAGNTRLDTEMSLFDEEAMNSWSLEELDVSGMALNDATVNVLSNYMKTLNSQNMKTLRLNSCGLTGSQVAQLFRDMGQVRDMTVHLNANRLDDGIEDLCGAIACGFGPSGLFMQMIEFAQEENYVKLLQALTVNKSIECLSLAGSSTPESASEIACQALAEFFSKNNTIRFLDLSGYDAKLDEGRLGRGFSTALKGLCNNTRLEHLRVRSQMLNFNIGDLAEAISANRTLHTLDCEGNDFNLSNFRHLVRHLEENTTIRYFSAFSNRDLARTIQRSVDNAISATTPARRGSVMSRFRHERSQPNVSRPLVQQLKNGWDDAVETLQRIIERNQMIFQEGVDSRRDSSPHLCTMNNPGEAAFSKAFGGLALRAFESQRARTRSNSNTPPQRSSAVSLPVTASRFQGLSIDPGRNMRSYSLVSTDSALSPATDSQSSGSAIPTPPELDSPVERECLLSNGRLGVSSEQPLGLVYNSFSPDGQDNEFGPDFGLEMRSHRRFWSDRDDCIEEEDNAHTENNRLG